MQPVTYDLIEPNVAELDAVGDRVNVVWKCPVSGSVVGESYGVMKSNQTADAVKAAVTKSIVGSVLQSILDSIGSTIGGMTGKVARAAAIPTAQGVIRSATAPKYTEAMRRKAVVEAFKAVESKFHWDEDRGMFVA
jgi:hypothetical protein